MSRKNKRPSSTKKHITTPADHAHEVQHSEKENQREILREFGFSLAATVVLWLLLFVFLDKSPFAEDLRWITFRTLESSWWFRGAADESKLPVIVDISNLQPKGDDRNPTETEQVTPRAELKTILHDLICPDENPKSGQSAGQDPDRMCKGKADKDGPAVIGIDIDFSPESAIGKTGTVSALQNAANVVTANESGREDWRFLDSRHDPEFFNSCLDLDVPVFLGVYRTIHLPPDRWLLLPEYRRLAVALPLEEKPEHILETTWNSPTFAWALAQVYLNRKPENGRVAEENEGSLTGRLNDLFLERQTETDVFGVGKVIIDYRSLAGIETSDYTIAYNDVKRERKKLKGRIVIIGDVHPQRRESPQQDLFDVPSAAAKSAGVKVQAAAVYTMISPRGLLMLRRPWEATADLICAFTLHWLILIFRRAGRKELNELRLLCICFAAGALMVFLIGVAVSRWILWDGCFVVGSTLAFEPIWHLMTTKVVQVSWSGVKHVRHGKS